MSASTMRIAHRPAEPVALLRTASARAEHLLAVLGKPEYGFAFLPADDIRCAPAHTACRNASTAPPSTSGTSTYSSTQPPRGCDQDLVGHPSECALPGAGDAHLRRVHDARRCDCAGGADDLRHAHVVPAAHQESALAYLQPDAVAGESLARECATARTKVSWTWPRASSCRSTG